MIRSLAYVGFASPDAAEWATFGPEVLATPATVRADGTVALRVDDYADRIMVHPGVRHDLAYLGWDCGDADGLAGARAVVEGAGFTAVDEPDIASIRQVASLVSFVDPFGFRHELTYGLAEISPFEPARPMNGFKTGEQGLGHMVLMVPDLEAGLAFFTDVLGFGVSDHIEAGLSLRFLHCNGRHHTIALSGVPGMAGVHHLMLEVNDIDDVGIAHDIVNAKGLTLAMSLGRHTNDLMTSFYVRTPSGFEIEYGAGGREVGDDWEVTTYDAMSIWGHKPPAERLVPGIIRHVSTGA